MGQQSITPWVKLCSVVMYIFDESLQIKPLTVICVYHGGQIHNLVTRPKRSY